jgi:hypothetical protein
VILVAVTLVIAIGVVGWIMGWWGAIGATEQLQIYGDSKLKVTNNSVTVELHVGNKGSASAVIYKIEVASVAASTITATTTQTGITCSGSMCTVTPGADGTIVASFGTSLTVVPGTSYVVKVYTKAGNTYQITLVAEQV